MASSKSTIKCVDKVRLYFNKYSYKASISTQGVYWIRMCENMDKFYELVTDRYTEWDTNKGRYPHGWYREPMKYEAHDLDLIEHLINLRVSLKNTDTRFRHEYDTFTIYTNDESLINRLVDTRWRIEKAIASPNGVKYFKKDPPAKFRTYLTNNKVDPNFISEMIDYLDRTSDMSASDAFYTWLRRGKRHVYNYCWLNSFHFIDYNDEKNLMMMHLMFPGAIGATYKLEKK